MSLAQIDAFTGFSSPTCAGIRYCTSETLPFKNVTFTSLYT